MGLFTDSVPRELYDKLEARYDALLEKYHALRQSGYDPAQKIRMVPPKPDSGETVIRAGEQAFTDPRIRQAFTKCVDAGLSEADALREAYRLVNVASGKLDPEPIGNVTVSP